MLDLRSALIGGIAGFAAATLGVGFVACQKSGSDQVKSNPAGLPPQSDKELSTALAKIDDVVITVGEFQERINRQSPYVRARYTSLEQKKEFLDSLIQFEVLAGEAYERGFDKNPEVVRTMKQVMIQKLMKDEFESKVDPDDISDDEMKKFYEDHSDEYNKPAQVRVSAIITGDKATAQKAAKAAKSHDGKTNKGFRELVGKYSTDEKTKIRGGDLRYFAKSSADIPQGVRTAAFKLKKTGDVAGPIAAGGKYYVIKQTGKRKAVSKPFEDVKRQIQNRIYRKKRAKAQKTFIAELKKDAKITIYKKNLKKVRVDTSKKKKKSRGSNSFPADSHGNKQPAPLPTAPAAAPDNTDGVPIPGADPAPAADPPASAPDPVPTTP
jgi:peptidyl-prolyl cis-trans isomerase C